MGPGGGRGPMGGGRGPGMGIAAPGAKPKHARKTLKTIWSYLRTHHWRLFLSIVFAVASTVFAIIGPRMLGDMTNKVVDGYVAGQAYDKVMSGLPKGTKLPAGTTGATIINKMPDSIKSKIPSAQIDALKNVDFSKGRPAIDFGAITTLGLWLIGLYVLSSAFMYVQGWIMTSITQSVVYRLRRDISEKINRLPLSYFDKTPYGEIISRVTNDVDTIGQTLNQSATQLITSIVTIIGILVMMLTISWQLTLIALLVLPLSMGVISVIVKQSQRYFMGQQNTLGKLDGHVEEMFSGHAVMRAYNGEAASIRHFSGNNEELYHNGWKAQFTSGLMMPIMQFIGNLGFVGVAVVGGNLAVGGTLKIGDIQAFIQYMNQFTQPITQTANVANVLQTTIAAAERVFDFIEEPDEPVTAVTAELPSDIHGAVSFSNVQFSYNKGKPTIHDLTSTITPGQQVAIVGPTGAGKTTIINLLMRFYDIDKGTIAVDGIDTGELSRADVRRLFGMVLQDTWLFNGSIADNISYGKPDATREEIVEAAKAAHADHFIRTLPDGYDTVLGEETDNISTGEKQLLTIARAMLADAPMLILDEATSSVDTRTEALIQQAMKRLTIGRTSFVIAHRLSTIRGADLILVMQNGNIIEQGTHDQLVAAGGFYAGLWGSQFADADVAG